jgi:hypothetical protein
LEFRGFSCPGFKSICMAVCQCSDIFNVNSGTSQKCRLTLFLCFPNREFRAMISFLLYYSKANPFIQEFQIFLSFFLSFFFLEN